MAANLDTPAVVTEAGSSPAASRRESRLNLLTATEARRFLERRIGRAIPRYTFYYWLRHERIFCIRLGSKILVPRFAIEEACEQCLRGEQMSVNR